MRSKTLIFGLMIALTLTVLSVRVSVSSPQTPTATCVWNGTAGNWSDTARWTGCSGGVPGTNDVAVITAGTVTVDQGFTVLGLTFSGGTLDGSNTLTVTGVMTWTGGTMGGGGATTIASGAALHIDTSSASPVLGWRALNIASTATLTGTFPFYSVDIGPVNNSGTFEVLNDAGLRWYSGDQLIFNNSGLFRKTGGTGVSIVDGRFNNTGTVNVESGALRLSGGGSNSGAFAVNAGTMLQFNSDYTLNAGATLMGEGLYRLTGGTLTISSTLAVPNFEQTGATLGGSGTLTVTGGMTWTAGALSGSGATTIASGAALNINATSDCVYISGPQLTGRTLNIAGTATLSGTNSFCAQSGIINNSGLFDIVRDVNVWWNGGSSVILTNTGTLRKSGGAGASTWSSVPVNNVGTIQAQSGTLRLSSGGTSSGSYTAVPGATLDFGGGTHTISLSTGSSISGGGTVRVSNGTTTIGGSGSYAVTGNTDITGGTFSMNLDGTTANMAVSGGTLQGSNNLTVTQVMTWTGGMLSGSGATRIASGGTLTITANGDCVYTAGVALTGRTLNIAGTATLSGTNSFCAQSGTINNSGLFDIARDVNVWWNGGSSVILTNTGTLRKSGGTGTSTWSSVAVNNAANMQVMSGTLNFASFKQNDGVTMLNGGSLSSGSPLNFYGGALQGLGTITGNVFNLGGTVSPGMSPGSLRIVGNYTQGPTGTLTIELGGVISSTQYDVLNVTGAASLSGTLNVSLFNGFAPMTGTVFQVISYGSHSGGFSTFNGLDQSGGLVLSPYFSADSLSLLTLQSDVAAYKFAFSPRWTIAPSTAGSNPYGQILQRYLLRYYYHSPNPNPPDLTVALTDTLPLDLAFDAETHTPAMNWQQQGHTLTWQTQLPVQQGQSGLIQLDTTNTSPIAGKIITNQAQVGMGSLQYAMQAVSQVPVFPPLITWPESGEIYSGMVNVIGAAQPSLTITLYANNSAVMQTLADARGSFTATYTYLGMSAVTLTARACTAALCSEDSAPVTLSPPQSFWCPQRSVWSGTPTTGPKAGQALAFGFRNNTGQFSTQNWIIPGVYGFWNTTLTLYVGNYPGKSTPPDQVWLITDGQRYDPVNVAWPWYMFAVANAHSVEFCAQSGTNTICPPGNILIDPDGYLFDVTKGLSVTASTVDTVTGQIIPTTVTNTLKGITATAMVSMPQWGGWVPWPASLYNNQINPQVTKADGYFAFFTPPGDYYLQIDGAADYQSWRSPIVHVITDIVHVNVPLTPIGLGPSTAAVTLAQGGPSPTVITVPLGSTIAWTAELSGSLPMARLADLIDNPVLRLLSAHNPLTDLLGWDGGRLTPGQVYRRQMIRPGTYQYSDGIGHTGQVVVTGQVIYLPVMIRN